MKQKTLNYLLLSIFLIFIILFLVGLKLDWFSNIKNIYIDNTTHIDKDEDIIFNSCEEVCIDNNYHSGYDRIDECGVDEIHIDYGYPGEDALLSCCCIEDIEEDDNEEDSGYNVGDIVGGGSDDGILVGGDDSNSWEIDLGNIESGGNCYLGARINVFWDYNNDKCVNLQGFEDVNWYFMDSVTGRELPTTRGVQANFDYCPLNWDGVNNWEIKMIKTMNLPDCDIEYDWDIEVYVCECN